MWQVRKWKSEPSEVWHKSFLAYAFFIKADAAFYSRLTNNVFLHLHSDLEYQQVPVKFNWGFTMVTKRYSFPLFLISNKSVWSRVDWDIAEGNPTLTPKVLSSPQSRFRCTRRQCALTWVCSDSTQRTYADASPAGQANGLLVQTGFKMCLKVQTKIIPDAPFR